MKNRALFILLTFTTLSVFRANAQNAPLAITDFDPVIANWEDKIPVPAPGPGVWQFFTTGGSSEIIANPLIDQVNPSSDVVAFYRPSGEWLLAGFFYQDGITITEEMTGIELKIFSNNLAKCYVTVNGIVSGIADQKIIENEWPWTAPSGAGVWNIITLPINSALNLNDKVTTLLIFPNPQLPEASVIDTIYIDEVRFIVSSSVDSVVLNLSEVTLTIGQNTYLEAYVYPESASNKNISWLSLNTDIVKVSSIGKVTALGSGTAPVIVVSEDGNHTDTCWFIVGSAENISEMTAETLKIRPNPYFGGVLEIYFPGDPSAFTGLAVYNLLGHKVFSITAPLSDRRLVIEPQLPAGMFLIVAEQNGKFIYGKLIRK
jgi:uncharacterized protein YjdB